MTGVGGPIAVIPWGYGVNAVNEHVPDLSALRKWGTGCNYNIGNFPGLDRADNRIDAEHRRRVSGYGRESRIFGQTCFDCLANVTGELIRIGTVACERERDARGRDRRSIARSCLPAL